MMKYIEIKVGKMKCRSYNIAMLLCIRSQKILYDYFSFSRICCGYEHAGFPGQCSVVKLEKQPVVSRPSVLAASEAQPNRRNPA